METLREITRMSTPRLHSIPTSKRGRPKHIKTVAVDLIGSAGVSALESADIYLISGALARELALIIGEPAPQVQKQELTTATSE